MKLQLLEGVFHDYFNRFSHVSPAVKLLIQAVADHTALQRPSYHKRQANTADNPAVLPVAYYKIIPPVRFTV
ncbi:hypothetical protein D3C80_1898330 [compost metagenome]